MTVVPSDGGLRCASRAGRASLSDSLDAVNVLLGKIVVPAPGVPPSNTAPSIPRLVGMSRGGLVAKPPLISLVAGSPHRIGSVGVERGRLNRIRKRGAEEAVADLEDAPAFWALAPPAVFAQVVPWSAVILVSGPVTFHGLAPGRLRLSLCLYDPLVDSPLARGPLQDLLRRSGITAGHSGRDLGRRPLVVASSIEEALRTTDDCQPSCCIGRCLEQSPAKGSRAARTGRRWAGPHLEAGSRTSSAQGLGTLERPPSRSRRR